MRYEVEFTRPARRELDRLSLAVRRRIRPVIDRLADDPRPPGSRKLVGREGRHRIRVGDYRVIYQIRREVLIVLVLRVAHRREVYR